MEEQDEQQLNENTNLPDDTQAQGSIMSLGAMFQEYWIDYASDVILDRSVPSIDDGLKPVQRRILHAMRELDDGRYNKVANIVGATMAYHPHGDASIKDALVTIGQKELLVDCQGNWGNILTGDDAAAGRYIEARLTKFAREVCFNDRTTEWKPSYDGRRREPVSLPVKFPLLLAQGTKGIAVTLTSVIMPHNFCELIEGSISILKDEPVELYPDFPTGGKMDVSRYCDGGIGGRLRIRASMHYDEKRRAIIITEIPYGVTTGDVIDSIVKANEKGKIKIKKVDDNTASEVEIVIQLPSGVSPDRTIDALFAFTKCQVSITPQTCVIVNGKPTFMTVTEILRYSTFRTRDLLKMELEIQLDDLEARWHKVSLEKIFFEQRLYRHLEVDELSFDEQITAIERAFDPYRKLFKKEITRDDVLNLCEKPVRKMSRHDIKKDIEELLSIEAAIDETRGHLAHLTDFAINYFKHILQAFGKNHERKTEIRSFEDIEAANVAMANEKLYVNTLTGFAGYALKREEGVIVACDCSKMDDIIVFRRDGTFMVTKVQDKSFVGNSDCKEIILATVFRKKDDRTVYNMIYRDGAFGYAMVKRFSITAITRDREYNLTKGTKGTKVLYFTANRNGEAEVVTVHHASKPKLKKTSFDFDFASVAIKGKQSIGNILTRNAIRNISVKEEGISTLGARKIWFDSAVARLNTSSAGIYLGEFKGKDKILTISSSGYFKLSNFDLANHFDTDLVEIRKFNPKAIVTALYREASTGYTYIKRFLVEESDKRLPFIDIEQKDEFLMLCMDTFPRLEITYDLAASNKKIDVEVIDVSEFIAVKGYKAKGKRLTTSPIAALKWLDPLPEPEPSAEEPTDNEPPLRADENYAQVEGTQTSLF